MNFLKTTEKTFYEQKRQSRQQKKHTERYINTGPTTGKAIQGMEWDGWLFACLD